MDAREYSRVGWVTDKAVSEKGLFGQRLCDGFKNKINGDHPGAEAEKSKVNIQFDWVR